MITLRPMTMETADKMLEWKNYPETRRYTVASSKKVRRQDHLEWLRSNIHLFKVICRGRDVCGAIRVQERGGQHLA